MTNQCRNIAEITHATSTAQLPFLVMERDRKYSAQTRDYSGHETKKIIGKSQKFCYRQIFELFTFLIRDELSCLAYFLLDSLNERRGL